MRWVTMVVSSLVIVSCYTVLGLASVPAVITYQGRLTDTGGAPVSDGFYIMTFRLFDAPTGGTQLWNAPDGEQQVIEVTDGIYHLKLGAVETLTSTVFSGGSVWLEVDLYNASTSLWETFSPRQQLTASPYALRADLAENVANGVVGAAQLANQAVTTEKLADNAISSSKLAENSITSEKIAADAVLAADIFDGPGSALNADLLDNQHAAAFSLTDHTHNDYLLTTGGSLSGYLEVLNNHIRAQSIHSDQGFRILGYDVLVTPGERNTYIGLSAGENSKYSSSPPYENTYVGTEAGYCYQGTVCDGYENTIVGTRAGHHIDTGNFNTYVGAAAGANNSEEDYNVMIGHRTGLESLGGTNTYVGAQAGQTGNGNGNILLGYQAGYAANGSGNIFIGYQVGYDDTGDNRLIIDNQDTTSPLIQGSFQNGSEFLQVAGEFRVTKAVSVGTPEHSGRLLNMKNAVGEAWMGLDRFSDRHGGNVYLENGSTQWFFPYFRGWQSDNLIIRDEPNGRDVMTFEFGTGKVFVGTQDDPGTIDVYGSIYQRGSQLHADYVFEPEYRLQSIEEHAEAMWVDKHLPAVPRSRIDKNGQEVIEVGTHRKGMLEELEKAHIYIEQLNQRNKELKAEIALLKQLVCKKFVDEDYCMTAY